MKNKLIFEFFRNHYRLKGILTYKETQNNIAVFQLENNFKAVDIQSLILSSEQFSSLYTIQYYTMLRHALQIAFLLGGIAMYLLPKTVSLWTCIYTFISIVAVVVFFVFYFLYYQKKYNYLLFKEIDFNSNPSLKWIVAEDFLGNEQKDILYHFCSQHEYGLVHISHQEGFKAVINPIKITTQSSEVKPSRGIHILLWVLTILPFVYFFSHKTNQKNRLIESREQIESDYKYAPIDSKD